MSTIKANTFTAADLNTDLTITGNGTGIIALTSPTKAVPTTDNDLSFSMADNNNFICTPTGNGTLTFTNITNGQSGNILFVNTGGHTISLAATTKGNSNFASDISTAGTYWISYFSNGTNVYCAHSGAMV